MNNLEFLVRMLTFQEDGPLLSRHNFSNLQTKNNRPSLSFFCYTSSDESTKYITATVK